MKRNRKSQSASIRLVPAIKALLLCLLIGGACVGYGWQHKKLHELDAVQRSFEARLDLLRRDNRILSGQLADLQLPQSLQRHMQRLHVTLSPAQPGQLVRLPEPPGVPPAASAADWVAQRGAGVASKDTTD